MSSSPTLPPTASRTIAVGSCASAGSALSAAAAAAARSSRHLQGSCGKGKGNWGLVLSTFVFFLSQTRFFSFFFF